jgi:methionyl-tRNA formyltransferase
LNEHRPPKSPEGGLEKPYNNNCMTINNTHSEIPPLGGGGALRIIFMGTPDFAVASLDALVQNGFNIVGVISAPDKPAGRGRQIQQSAVKRYAVDKGLRVLQPEKLKNPEFLTELEGLKADLQIVVAFRMLPEVVWNMPKHGTFNLHASLLPQYRGAAPINWAIINGENETGVTTFFLTHEIDTGNIIFQEKVAIRENETAGELHDHLMAIGSELVIRTVKAIQTDDYAEIPQNDIKDENLKSAPKIFKEDCRINWNCDIETIYNKIRGLSPYPAAFTEIQKGDGNPIALKVFFGEKEFSQDTQPGKIASDGKNFLKVSGRNGYIKITDLQLAGKSRMKTEDFLRGFAMEADFRIV